MLARPVPNLVSADSPISLFLAVNEGHGTNLPSFSQGADLRVATRPSDGLQVLLGDATAGFADWGSGFLPHRGNPIRNNYQ